MKVKLAALMTSIALLLVGPPTSSRVAHAATQPLGTYVVFGFVSKVKEQGKNKTCALTKDTNFSFYLSYRGTATNVTATLLDSIHMLTVTLTLPAPPSSGTSWSGTYSSSVQPGGGSWSGNQTGTLDSTGTNSFVGSLTLTNWHGEGKAQNACTITIDYSALLLVPTPPI